MTLDKDLHAKLCTGNLENLCLRIYLNSGLQISPIAHQDFEILDLRIFRREEQKIRRHRLKTIYKHKKIPHVHTRECMYSF